MTTFRERCGFAQETPREADLMASLRQRFRAYPVSGLRTCDYAIIRRAVPTTEPTINDALANLLRKARRAWAGRGVVRSENTRSFQGNEKPDILVVEPNLPPFVIETEVVPAATVEQEARSRLGRRLRGSTHAVYSSLAVRLPVRLRSLEGDELTEELRRADDFQCALFQGDGPEENVRRWPNRGWLPAGVAQLAAIAQYAAIPPHLVVEASNRFIGGIDDAAGRLGEIASRSPGVMEHICKDLHQQDSAQTRGMAMTIVANAFILHETLAGGPGRLGAIRSVAALRNGSGKLAKRRVIQEWEHILAINYWPIFDIAKRIVTELPVDGATEILDRLADTGADLLSNHVTRSHDLTGAVFQRLIADRKFLAAFYTTPNAAAMLAALALSPEATPRSEEWADAEAVARLRVADFACGTGTLLSAAYHRVGQLHEVAGGNSSAIHPRIMSDVLVGCDVMPAASHLTASMLSSVHPGVSYEKSRIITVPYGLQDDGDVALGSLDLLKQQGTLSVIATTGRAVGSMEEHVANTWESLPSAAFDLVIMNPPYTRATGHEGAKIGVPLPMFAAFGNEKDEQRAMGEAMKKVARGSVYHGNAGEAAAFLQLANDKLRTGGRLALVMPLSLLAGEAWEKARALLRDRYSDLIVVTIAGQGAEEAASFSADTGMGECLIVATKTGPRSLDRDNDGNKPVVRATFAVLDRRPEHRLEAAELARLIHERRGHGVKKLEDGPVGGTLLSLGEDPLGAMIEAPLPEDDAGWGAARIKDFSLAQVAYSLTRGRVWLPGVPERDADALPIARTGALATVGPYHMDINGTQAGGGLRGPFTIEDLDPNEAPTYPVLWGHDASEERCIHVAPDSQGVLRSGRSKKERDFIAAKAEAIWDSASRVHVNRDFRFNSQSVAVAYTKDPSIGGRAWPSLRFTNERHAKAFALWSNTTLGLLLYWWVANKQQSGRGSVTITAIPDLPTLDVTAITGRQLADMVTAFDRLAHLPLLPFNEIEGDNGRTDLDKIVLGDILGLRGVNTMPMLKRKLAREPSVAGHKRRAAISVAPVTGKTAKRHKPAEPYGEAYEEMRAVADSVRPGPAKPRKR